MCGIAGELGTASGAAVRSMVALLRHRGPDDSGVWEDGAVALGHTRLAVLDLSSAGAQPMQSSSGRAVVTFNGEIYNWRELREELELCGHRFRSRCDTEVLLAAYEQFGIAMLERLNGMFAFALWDRGEHVLHLVRDRFGKKPLLYSYGASTGVTTFASELRCFRADRLLDPTALAFYLSTNFIPAPYTIAASVRRVPPGHRVEVRPGSPPGEPVRWFDPVQVVVPQGSLQDAVRGAVHRRLYADVPVGVFLSGGVDSSIVATMAAQSVGKIVTLNVGYADSPGLDEREHARRTASALGADHREILVTAAEAQRAVAEVLELNDAPFADDSLVPTYVVSKAARAEVTVALSGDGGDELFGGYWKYLAYRWGRLPAHALAGRLIELAASALPESRETAFGNVVRQARRLARAMRADDLVHRTRALVAVLDYGLVRELSHLELPEADPLIGRVRRDLASTSSWADEMSRVLMADVRHVLPDDMLEKVDRASMWASLEVRCPFLDPDVFRHAFAYRGSDHVGWTRTKRVLRDAFRDVLPEGVVGRRKRGFGIPLGEWFRGPLRHIVDDTLAPSELRRTGLLNPDVVSMLVAQHESRRIDRSWELWNAIVLQTWASR